MKRLKVSVLGNHSVPWCTERELDWTFSHLGHQVLALQENTISTDQIMNACVAQGTDLLVYVHTHGWRTPGPYSLDSLIKMLRHRGVKTCSFHLDRYWGLNLCDHREDDIGHTPFWMTDVVFTADGGNQARFLDRGVKHHWLPPGVVEHECVPGVWRPEFACDVAFVGQKSYHPEYPFRGQLIDWLQRTYGSRFRLFPAPGQQAIRLSMLNDLYASARLVVGDCCFAGAAYYWSDRVPETIGRGGFLIHPRVEGLKIPYMLQFEPGNLDDLKQRIDDWLLPEKIEARDEWRMISHLHVKGHDTYTHRVRTMLEVLGFAEKSEDALPANV